MEFRRSAVDTLEGPEDLDTPVRLTRPRGWIALAGLCLVVVIGGVWAFAGELPRDVAATGVLAAPPKSFAVQSPAEGQLTEVLVTAGSTVQAGAPVAKMTTENGIQTVRAGMAGRVTAVSAKPGQFVAAGATLASLGGSTERMVAVVAISEERAATIAVGRDVDLTVQSVPTQTYGVLRGQVISVERGQVLVALLPSEQTMSGYAWSTRTGPPDALVAGTPVTATVHLAPLRPIDVMTP